MKSITRISIALMLCPLWMVVAAQSSRYTVQIEASPALNSAQEKVAKLKNQGVDAYIVKSPALKNGTFYRVRVGEFPSQAEARKFGMDLQKRGIVSKFFIAAFVRPQENSTPPTTTGAQAPEKVTPATPVKALSKTQNQAAISPPSSPLAESPSPATQVQSKSRESHSAVTIEQPDPKRRQAQEEIPTGASALCRDGAYSFSQHRRGTCSHHGGVARWLY
jgi:hypothetical protein